MLFVALMAAFGLWRSTKAHCFQWAGDVPVCHVDTAERVVALSFDDGPTPEGVDIVLPALEAAGVHATFFLIGSKMERHPGQAERLLAAGHELGNHSYSHIRNLGRSGTFYDAEISRTDRLLRTAGVQNPRLFRPPFGRKFIGLPRAVVRAGYRTIMWDVEDDVANHPTPQDYADDIVSRASPGSIILIHPMYRTNPIERAALPLVLAGLQRRGFRIVTVSVLLALER